MRKRRGQRRSKKPRLPAGLPSFQALVPETVKAIDDSNTEGEEAARLFGDRYGFLIAVEDAFGQSRSRSAPVKRAVEMTLGLVAGGKKLLQEAWADRARAETVRTLRADFERWRAEGMSEDPLAFLDEEIDAIDRERSRARAAVRMAERWSWLGELALHMQDLRGGYSADQQRDVVDPLIRSAAHWRFELEKAWTTRSFYELLGRPSFEELLVLVYPQARFGPD